MQNISSKSDAANAVTIVKQPAPGVTDSAKSYLVGPKATGNAAPVPSVGSVYPTHHAVKVGNALNTIDFTLDNSLGVAPANYMIFDYFGFYVANTGVTVKDPDSASSSYAAIQKMSAASPILIKGYNYEVTVSPTQFQNAIKVTFGDADGTADASPVPPNQAKRNNQFNPNLLTFEGDWYIDGFRGMLIKVNTGETVQISLFIGQNFNRQ